MRVLGYDLNLIELKLDGGLAAKHRNDYVDSVVVDLNALHSAGEGTQGTIQNPDGIANCVVNDDFLLFHAHSVDFLFGQGSGVVAGCSDEAGHSADVPDNMPGIITVDHLHQHVAGENLTVVGLAYTGFCDFRNRLQRNGDGQNLVVQATGLNGLLNGSLYSVLITGVGMHNIPLCSLCHDFVP